MLEQPINLEPKWQGFLDELDAQLSSPVQLICIGGFVVTAIHGFSRSTEDLDHIESCRENIAELDKIAGKGSPLHKKHNLYIDYVGVVTMPIDFMERLIQVPVACKNITFFMPEIYDLVLSKLERNSPKDYSDVEYLANKYLLSFATVLRRFNEELDFIPNRERHLQTLTVFWQEWFQA
jgi:hypothetical protein